MVDTGRNKQEADTTIKKEPEKSTPATLQEVKNIYKKWLYLDSDDEVIDIVYACFVDRKINGDPLWMAIISPSGGTKTEIVRANRTKDAYTLDSLTAHTLISGKVEMDEDGNPIPVQGILKEINGKVLIIKDFTIILAKRQEERDEIFSQFRGLYDGYLEYGYGTLKEPLKIPAKIGLVIAVTPAIDQYSKLYVQLGERFLKVRHQPNSEKATNKALENLGKEEEMRLELETIAKRFLENLPIPEIKPINQEYFNTIKKLAHATAILRTPVSINFFKSEVISALTPSIEYPTRLSKQLLKLAYALAYVRGKNEVTNDEMLTVQRVAKDTVYPCRIKILRAISNGKQYKTREISQKTGIPLSTCWRELKEMEYLGVINYQKSEEYISIYKPKNHNPEEDGWILNQKTLKILIKKIQNRRQTRLFSKNNLKKSNINLITVSPNPTRQDIGNNKRIMAEKCQDPLVFNETENKPKENKNSDEKKDIYYKWVNKEFEPIDCQKCGKNKATHKTSNTKRFEQQTYFCMTCFHSDKIQNEKNGFIYRLLGEDSYA